MLQTSFNYILIIRTDVPLVNKFRIKDDIVYLDRSYQQFLTVQHTDYLPTP